jgi:uncharacterized OsmC-like protein
MASIETLLRDDLTLEARIGDHVLEADVPESMGGRGRAPLPPQIFIASLGTCVAAVVADYCRRHELDPAGLRVRTDFDQADQPKRLQNLRVHITLPNVECDDACSAAVIARVAEHCPVHQTIASLEDVRFTVGAGTGGAS